MSDLQKEIGDFLHRPALAGLEGGVQLTALPEGHVILMLGRAGASSPALDGLRLAGPGQWFLVGDAPLSAAEVAALAATPDCAISDQSHGRARIAVVGPCAAALLAKGTALDLEGLAVGASATTLLGPIGVHLTRTGPEAFELMALRSFAVSLWTDLMEMAAEYEG